jgi:hypothetical protein
MLMAFCYYAATHLWQHTAEAPRSSATQLK